MMAKTPAQEADAQERNEELKRRLEEWRKEPEKVRAVAEAVKRQGDKK